MFLIIKLLLLLLMIQLLLYIMVYMIVMFFMLCVLYFFCCIIISYLFCGSYCKWVLIVMAVKIFCKKRQISNANNKVKSRCKWNLFCTHLI